MRNYFILDEVDSRDFGVYISGQGTFNASARDYNVIPVPGRNGDLIGPEKRFQNGMLTYPAFIYSNFKKNVEDFRNFLLSLVGYHDLVDSYHPDEIRKVLFRGPFETEVETKNDAGRFDIVFECKPQRFLASGNEVTTFESTGGTETFSGSVVTFDNPGGATVSALSTVINPTQDLNGYDKPWGPGAGTNKFDKDHNINSIHTSSIATALSTYKSTGEYATGYTTNATSITANAQYCTSFTPCASGTTYTIKNLTSGGNLALVGFVDDTGTVVSHNSSWSNQAWTHMATATEKYIMVCAKVAELGNVMIVEGNTMPSTWSPYANICPISGDTEANIVVSPTLDAQDGTTYTVPFDATAYAGTLDVTSGVLKKRPSYASYNGEALVGPWISSMDAYAVGTTPTTGAQVVDLGGAETTVTLTPTEVNLLLGTNNIWSDTGDITVTIEFPQEQFTITNPTLFDSQPLLRVYGVGALGIGSQTVTITQADVYTDIDCEMMDAFKGTANKNPYVQLTDHNFPVFKPGVNNISLGTGITKVEITPRWWIV